MYILPHYVVASTCMCVRMYVHVRNLKHVCLPSSPPPPPFLGICSVGLWIWNTVLLVVNPVSHVIPRPQITTGDIVSRQFCGNHPCLKISVIIPGRQPCPMVITEIFRNGPYYHGTQYSRGNLWDTVCGTQETLPPAVLYVCMHIEWMNGRKIALSPSILHVGIKEY